MSLDEQIRVKEALRREINRKNFTAKQQRHGETREVLVENKAPPAQPKGVRIQNSYQILNAEF